ncbi:uncharacterized protein BHQ10_001397 [Talaromyces amestolkiae]|uniref:Uncharacterized protein n=1 Tax=Talaromyces amestolkiae TaxID=1196081 RepID=A0A364KPC8_TALAM|nr:uncharacterized protein BHQ10_001397 [Talaromyces amestolkiae]RAO65385.1 hypothetical protein BHQ10_001397 [Talaromyces amestolkiae]
MASIPPPTTAAPPPTATTTLKTLTFEKKNTHLLHIPSKQNGDSNKKTYRIAKRPIPRAPIASPYAGSHVPKPVYISSKTPFMSAVKRVQKLLRAAERRAMAPLLGMGGRRRHPYHHQHAGKGGRDVLEKCRAKLREEKVLIKATGRAIEKALSVGRWFEEGKGGGGEEYEVVVRTGSVCVVDDIVEEDVSISDHEDEEEEEGEGGGSVDPDITMSMTATNSTTNTHDKDAVTEDKQEKEESKNQRRRRRKRERIREQRLKAFVDEDGETPESRTRWVNTVEIAINIK